MTQLPNDASQLPASSVPDAHEKHDASRFV